MSLVQHPWKRLAGTLVLLGCAFAVPAAEPSPSALEEDSQGWTDLIAKSGSDLKGWNRVPIPADGKLVPKSVWSLDPSGETLICDGHAHEMLLWNEELGDAVFHVEWRYTKVPGKKGYNSGLYTRNSADGAIWHQAQIGDASGGFLFGESPVNGQKKYFNLSKQLHDERVKPAGEWNTVELTATGKTITVWVNGAVVQTWSDCEAPKGYVGLESEGWRIEFRNLKVKKL
jgi:hypothetical protein